METNNSEQKNVIETLKNQIKKASKHLEAKMVVEDGSYKTVISSNKIENFHNNTLISTVKSAELEQDVLDFINNNPEEAAKEILASFQNSYKTAANSVLDENTSSKTTEKQLEDQKAKLHPRTGEYPNNITEKQMPENNQRPGTYSATTEAQLRDEKTTFYGKERTSGERREEDRNMVTESQLGEIDKYNNLPNRGEMGSKFDGGNEKQVNITGEKQLQELLSHHTWDQPLTITEDQLSAQEGELSRMASDQLKEIVKEATNAFAKTVIATGVTPNHLIDIASRLVSHESKIPAFVDVLGKFSNSDLSKIDKKIEKAQHFGKTANTSQEWSDNLVADVLVRMLSKNNNKYAMAQSVSALVEDTNFSNSITEASDKILAQKANKNNIFKQVLSATPTKEILDDNDLTNDDQNNGGKKPKNKKEKEASSLMSIGSNEDGLYAYSGDLDEISVNAEESESFNKAAYSHSLKQIKAYVNNPNLEPHSINVNTDNNTFEAIFIDKEQAKKYKIAQRMKARESLVKEAQVGGGSPQMPAGAPEMGNPQMPPTGGDMGMPPAESLSQNPQPEMPTEPESSNEPMAPGTFCPICKSEDVDMESGEFKCNECGTQGSVETLIKIKKAPGVIEDKTKEKEGFDLDSESQPGEVPPSVPIAASIKLNYKTLQKLANTKSAFGSTCPNCSSSDTSLTRTKNAGRLSGFCWTCNQNYSVMAKKNSSGLVGQYIWTPIKEANCNSCNRLKNSFTKALDSYGLTFNEFMNNYDKVAQANIIVKMASAGLWNNKAVKENMPLKKIAASARWKEYEKFDKFPMASCVAKLAKKYGENATSMSGPCEGLNLANCVCSQLSGLGIYTDGLAAKVAKIHASKDPYINSPMKTCIAMFVKEENMGIDEACTACDGLRAAYASAEELAIEAIAQIKPQMSKPLAKPMDEVITDSEELDTDNNDPTLDQPESDSLDMQEPTLDTECETCDTDNSDIDNPDLGSDNLDSPDNGMSELSVSMEGDLGSLLDSDSIGFEDKSVTIKLPEDAVESLKTLFDALKGQIDVDTDDMSSDLDGDPTDSVTPEDTGLDNVDTDMDTEDSDMDTLPDSVSLDDEPLDVSDVTEEDGMEDEENSLEEIPGLDEDATEESETAKFNDDELEMDADKDMPKPALSKHTEVQTKEDGCKCNCDCSGNTSGKDNKKSDDKKSDKSEKSNKPENKSDEPKESEESNDKEESKDDSDNEKKANLDNFLYSMKKGANRTYKDSTNNLYERIMSQLSEKTAQKVKNEETKVEYKTLTEKKVNKSPAQDSSEIGKYSDGKTMGHEEKFDAKTPDVPRKSQLLGDEDKSLTVNETSDMPSIGTNGKTMEGEENYKPEKQTTVDGNQGGKKASLK